jgi:uncharacterized protein
VGTLEHREIARPGINNVGWGIRDAAWIFALSILVGFLLLLHPVVLKHAVIAEYGMALTTLILTITTVQRKYGLSIKSLGYRLPPLASKTSVSRILILSGIGGVGAFLLLSMIEPSARSAIANANILNRWPAFASAATMIPFTPNGFFLVVLGPLSEELFFRGFLLQAIEKRARPFMAICIQAVLFGLIHTAFSSNIQIGSFGEAFLGGVVLGILFVRYRSIAVCLSFHSAMNWAQALTTWAINTSV